MADAQSNDFNNALNLTPQEKSAYAYLFKLADTDSLGVLTGENAITFFEKTRVPAPILGEIWQIADTENRGLLTKPGFCTVMRLIGFYQAGEHPRAELALKPAPLPRFDGVTIPGIEPVQPRSPSTGQFPPGILQPQLSGQSAGGGPIRIPPLDFAKVQQYSSLFERSGAQNGMLDGVTAKSIFERSGLPNEMLGKIWMLSDREQRGLLDQTEFIVAMHLLTSIKSRAMTALPNTLPPGLYDAAARRGQRPPSRQLSGQAPVPVPRQVTGPQRAQSPLSRSTPPILSANATGPLWLITAQEKAQYDTFFASIDTARVGVISGEQAVRFFSDSRLPDDTLASIWDLADINSAGQLNRDEFAVAMYLIRQQRQPNAPALPAFLPPALIPPSMRGQQQQIHHSTAPSFDNPAAAPPSNIPRSAAEDLFGLDEPTPPQQPVLQPQTTGTSATRDPFGSQPSSPSPAQRFHPQPNAATNTTFKPFIPTSAFGASLAQQNTGDSSTSSQARTIQAPPRLATQPIPSASDDLLGDNETQAAESNKITTESTELANMSNQIGNLRTQMQQTQTTKQTTQAELLTTSTQKRDLEVRLQQFRAQYEAEVRTVKDLEQQLSASKESTKKLGQELALLEGTYQDLQTQHGQVAQALRADQEENAGLKQRISQINAEVARLKPELEKLKMDARQQKGLVSINKKQLSTNEGERDRLQSEKSELEQEAARATAASPEPMPQSRNIASPTPSTMSSTNPFFRKSSGPTSASPPPPAATSGPTPSAFDALFGPSSVFAPTGQASSRSGTPPATSFIGRSLSPESTGASALGGTVAGGVTAFAATEAVEHLGAHHEASPQNAASSPLALDTPSQEPPPPPVSRQFTAANLPISSTALEAGSEAASSVRAIPPASRASGPATPGEVSMLSMNETENIPGAFPEESATEITSADEQLTPTATPSRSGAAHDEFESAFANFGEGHNAHEATDGHDPFGQSKTTSIEQHSGFNNEFPPIQNLEREDDSSSDSEDERGGFEDSFTSAKQSHGVETNSTATTSTGAGLFKSATVVPPVATSATPEPPPITQQQPPPAYEDKTNKEGGPNKFPPEFTGLLPPRTDPTTEASKAAFASESAFETPASQSAFATGNSATSSSSSGEAAFHDAAAHSGQQTSTATATQPVSSKNAFDEFDAFDDLHEAHEHKHNSDGPDLDFGRQSVDEFNPAFDSPTTSTTHTSIVRNVQQSQDGTNGFTNFSPNASTTSAFASSTQASGTSQAFDHDWDAIFSGLDSGNVDASLSNSNDDPWGSKAATSESKTAATKTSTLNTQTYPLGHAITPGTEHDDPILKRLTGMGYERSDALSALEKYDYDINRAVDHLTSNS